VDLLRIRYERELCCDDLAVSLVGDVATYTRALAKLEMLRVMQPSYAMGATRGPLFRRIEQLLDAKRPEQGPSRLACAGGLLAGLSFVLNMSWAQERKDEVPTSSKGSSELHH
jgi:hypothetical protein